MLMHEKTCVIPIFDIIHTHTHTLMLLSHLSEYPYEYEHLKFAAYRRKWENLIHYECFQNVLRS